MYKNVYILGVLVLLSAALIVGDGFFRTARSLDKLNSTTLRGITGAEGLSVTPHPSGSVPVSGYFDNLLSQPLTGSSSLENPELSSETNRTKIALTGNPSGIRTNYLLGSGERSHSGLTRVDSAGPFSINLTVVPTLYGSRSNGSGISMPMPELSGTVGGDFMINSPQRKLSAGRISIGNLHTPVLMNIHTAP